MHDQNLDLQKDALKGASCERTFLDEISGSTKHRPGLERGLRLVMEQDYTLRRKSRLAHALRSVQE